MNFSENPKLYIKEYYFEKRNQIDINCEQVIFKIEQETKKAIPNELRQILNSL